MARHARLLNEGTRNTRDRILAVACELFARRGYRGTTIRMIAEGAGLTDPGVYYYFETKRELHDALLVEPLIEAPLSASSGRDSAITALMGFFTSYAASGNLVRLSFREQISGTPAAIQFRRDNDRTYREMVGPFFRTYFGEDAARREDIVTFMLCGLFWDAILRYGEKFEYVVREDGFQQRMREMLESALPPRGALTD